MAPVMSRQHSSFYWPMRLLPRAKRDALFAVYGFCRAVDDISDGPGSADEKRARLAVLRGAVAAWRETGIALHPALAALAPHLTRLSLPSAELDQMLDGMESDVNQPLTAPDPAALALYCRQVAGSVGILIVHVLGRPDAERFAILSGEALQLTNILRDVAEDAHLGRLYLPRPVLEAAGILTPTPLATLSHPGLGQACRALAAQAEAKFAAAHAELDRIGGAQLWPAMAMIAIYRAQLQRLDRPDWSAPPPRLGHWHRLLIALCAARI